MTGRLYGVGVGPGDPELLTLKAVRVMEECDVIAAPGKNPEETAAFRIAAGACEAIKEKELLGIYMPMTKDKEILRESHRQGIRSLTQMLDQGKTIAFLTLGDPTIYSTYSYLHAEIERLGYETRYISGIPSFCAAAARLNREIASGAEQIHIVPASYQIEEALSLPGRKILMKAGKKLPKVKELLLERGSDVIMVENCGMEGERIYDDAQQMPEDAGYYTLLFVKDKGEEE